MALRKAAGSQAPWVSALLRPCQLCPRGCDSEVGWWCVNGLAILNIECTVAGRVTLGVLSGGGTSEGTACKSEWVFND